jgi:predicted transcriptional regulator
LCEWSFLIRRKQVSYYSPIISEQEHTLEQTQNLIDKLFGGDAKQLVSMLCENKKINAGEIEYLRKIWEGDGSDR